MEFIDVSEKQYVEIAEKIKKYGLDYKIWTFNGNLGAGKTTLIKYLAKAFGQTENIQSPTFAIVNPIGQEIFHFDCYRIKSLTEAMDFGMEEYLDSGKNCWIEWPEVIAQLILDDYLEIKIEDTGKNSRNIFINKNGI